MTIRYTFIASNLNTSDQVEISERFPEGTTWTALACVFHKFLQANSYLVDDEKLSASWQDYVDAKAELEEGSDSVNY